MHKLPKREVLGGRISRHLPVPLGFFFFFLMLVICSVFFVFCVLFFVLSVFESRLPDRLRSSTLFLNWSTWSHDEWLSSSVPIHLLVIHCRPDPSNNPREKSQKGSDLGNVGSDLQTHLDPESVDKIFDKCWICRHTWTLSQGKDFPQTELAMRGRGGVK